MSGTTPLAIAARALEPRTRVGVSGKHLQRVVTWHNNGKLEELHGYWHRVGWEDSGQGRNGIAGDLPLRAVQQLAVDSGFVFGCPCAADDDAPLQARADVPRMLAACGCSNVTEFRERFWTEHMEAPVAAVASRTTTAALASANAAGGRGATGSARRAWRSASYGAAGAGGGAAPDEKLRAGVGGKRAKGAGSAASLNAGPGGAPPAQYHGEFNGNTFDGVGRVECTDGSTYAGEFVRGAPHGIGVAEFACGARYAGRFSRGVTGSVGVFTWHAGILGAGGHVSTPTGRVVPIEYAGGHRGCFHGRGILTDADGVQHGGFFDGVDCVKWLPPEDAGAVSGTSLAGWASTRDSAQIARGQAAAAEKLASEVARRATRESAKAKIAKTKAIEAAHAPLMLGWRDDTESGGLLVASEARGLRGGTGLLEDGNGKPMQLPFADGRGRDPQTPQADEAENTRSAKSELAAATPLVDLSSLKGALPTGVGGYQRPQRPPRKQMPYADVG